MKLLKNVKKTKGRGFKLQDLHGLHVKKSALIFSRGLQRQYAEGSTLKAESKGKKLSLAEPAELSEKGRGIALRVKK